MKPKGSKDYPVQFFVMPTKSSPILGLEAHQHFNLIQRISQIKQLNENIDERYSEVFGEIGCLPGEYHISLTEGASPIRRNLYASTGYWQIKVDDESSNILTFICLICSILLIQI